MKRLLLSACLVGVVFAGYPPHPLHTNQVTPAAADASNERSVSIVPKSRTVERVAYLRKLDRYRSVAWELIWERLRPLAHARIDAVEALYASFELGVAD